jgi:hypothetical protein
MPDTLDLAIDPYLMCLPDPCYSPEQIESCVNALLGWSSMLRRQNARVLVADATRIALLEDGEYPHQHRLRELLREHRWEVADHETICRLTQNLLDRTPSLEEFYGVDAVLIDDTNTRVTPDALVERLKSKTRAAFIEMLVILLVEQQATTAGDNQQTFIASALQMADEGDAAFDVQCDSELQDWQWLAEARHSLPSLPKAVSGTIPLATSHKTLLRQLGIWEVWKHAEKDQAAIDAIELCIDDLLASGVSGVRRTQFRLGAHFLESARKWGFGGRSDYASVLIESCARIILSIPKHSMDVFRDSADSQRQRARNDGAVAYRTHLTKKGPGFRLMLWKLVNGTIEFANVGDKDELTIL